MTAISQPVLRQMPPGATSAVHAHLQRVQRAHPAARALRQGLSEQQLFDYGVNFIRTQLVTVPGCAIPIRTAASSARSWSISTPRRCRPKGLSPADVIKAIANQNLILPAGTSKIGQFEYDVD